MKAAATHLENAGSLSALTRESRPAAFRVSGFNVFAEDMETPYMFSEEDISFVLHAVMQTMHIMLIIKIMRFITG